MNTFLLVAAALCFFILCYVFFNELFLSKKRTKRIIKAQESSTSGYNSQRTRYTDKRRDIVKRISDADQEDARKKVRLKTKIKYLFPQESTQRVTILYVLLAALQFLTMFQMGVPVHIAAIIGGIGGVAATVWFINYRFQKCMSEFLDEFVVALDVIIRGVRSGLGLSDCIAIVVEEAPDIIKVEFQTIISSLQIGLPFEEVLLRFSRRLPLTEVKFFSTVLIIQHKMGGNLSEILQSLANLLRERKRLLGKIKAMSSEAKASSTIIGSLPFVVSGLIYLSSPNYMDPLFDTHLGNVILIIASIWLSIGIFIIRKMSNFYK